MILVQFLKPNFLDISPFESVRRKYRPEKRNSKTNFATHQPNLAKSNIYLDGILRWNSLVLPRRVTVVFGKEDKTAVFHPTYNNNKNNHTAFRGKSIHHYNFNEFHIQGCKVRKKSNN